MLGDIISYGAELNWLCGSVFGLASAITTNISQRCNVANSGRYASTLFPALSTTSTSIHSIITQVLGIALRAVYRTRYRFSEGMQRIALQRYMRNMETLSASLQIHFLTLQPKRGQVYH
jgi:hypothetical protein